METAESIISDALVEILVQQSEQPIQAEDFQIGRRYLNRMMAMSPFNKLGYTVVTNPADLITVPDGAMFGIFKSLAKALLVPYDMPLTNELSLDVREGMKEIRRLAVKLQLSSYPCTLPVGSGNEGDGTFNNQHFYSCPDDELSTEQEGSILLESGTDG